MVEYYIKVDDKFINIDEVDGILEVIFVSEKDKCMWENYDIRIFNQWLRRIIKNYRKVESFYVIGNSVHLHDSYLDGELQ